MASLSEEMRNKRDIKRKSEVLIVDKDLGNFGLYKAMLSMEYVLECAYNIEMARQISQARRFDVMIFDGAFEANDIEMLCQELKEKYGNLMPELLVMLEENSREDIIRYLCIGAKGYITKPFSKEGMSNAIYDALQVRRGMEKKHSIVIVDKDFDSMKAMKNVLGKKWRLNIINDIDIAKDYVVKKQPDLLIVEVSMISDSDCICDIFTGKGEDKRKVLFLADALDADIISRCAEYDPEGILMKPVPDDVLLQTIEKIFIRKSYVDDFDKR